MKNRKVFIVSLIWCLSTLLWVAHPFLMIGFYEVTQHLDWYPPEADSIGIPIAGGFLIAVLGYPFLFVLCCAASVAAQPPLRFLSWDRSRPWRSSLISALFGILALFSLESAFYSYKLLQEIRASELKDRQDVAVYRIVFSLGWVLLWLTLRSCFMSHSEKTDGGNAPLDESASA